MDYFLHLFGHVQNAGATTMLIFIAHPQLPCRRRSETIYQTAPITVKVPTVLFDMVFHMYDQQ